MKDTKTTITGAIGALIAILTLILDAVQGKPIDLPTVTATINQLVLAFGLIKAADSK